MKTNGGTCEHFYSLYKVEHNTKKNNYSSNHLVHTSFVDSNSRIIQVLYPVSHYSYRKKEGIPDALNQPGNKMSFSEF